MNVTPKEWEAFQNAVKYSTFTLWVTCGILRSGGDPLYAMVSGLARGIKTEDNSIRLSILDIDGVPHTSDSQLFSIIGQLEGRVSNPRRFNDNAEFRYKDGILYTSRLTSDDTLCESSEDLANPDNAMERTTLKRFKAQPLQLAIEKPGVSSTVYFKDDPEFARPLPADQVEIEVKYAGINNRISLSLLAVITRTA